MNRKILRNTVLGLVGFLFFFGSPYARGDEGKNPEPSRPYFYDAEEKLLGQIKNLTETTTSLNYLLQGLEEKGIDCSYQKIALAVAENFLGYAALDAKRKEIKRAQDATGEIETMLKEAKKDLEKISSGSCKPPEVPRYVTSPIKIEGPSFVAETKTISGNTEVRPVFFNGYGAFAQVVDDIEKFPKYGTNIIQIEFGPNSIFPSEGEISDGVVKGFLAIADRARDHNVAINLLLSPHYFPEWVKNKYPHLKNCSGWFIQYCIDAPESRKVLEDFLKFVIPRIKDHPALHSICLSNEPTYIESRNCEFTKKAWKEWLGKKHTDIQTLNKNYNADYASFENVPIPAPKVTGEPIFYDWCIFNAERFAGWHEWMAGIIHSIAPDIPVHAKVPINMVVDDRTGVNMGLDVELFGELSQINGNDCEKYYTKNGIYKNGWLVENMAYDLQTSVANKPVFNSENHLILNGDLGYIPPMHIRNVLWQGAIHGQSATTIWIWERTYGETPDFVGSIMHRPACAQMVGITNLDLLRFSKEVAAIQKVKPQILLLYSVSSIVYSQKALPLLQKVYEVLNFSGVKIGFITERQLAGGKLPPAKIIVIPGTTHITDAGFSGLKRFMEQGGKVVFAGENLLSCNEYNKTRKENIKPYLKIDISQNNAALFNQFLELISELELDSPVKIIEASTEKPPLGVEYLAARDKDRLIVNIVNYVGDKKSVKILYNGKPALAKNLFNEKQAAILSLAPLEPVLVEIK